MDGGSACTSRLTLYFGSAAPPAQPGPGDVTDAEDEHLRALRRTVVEPVVASLLTDDELEQVMVSWGVDGEPDDVWVRVAAAGEVFEDLLFSPSWRLGQPDGGHASLTPRQCAERLADRLEDWIAESGFGWGQQRTARYVLPPS